MVRRITPVTERCQPPSSVTRGARPPPPSARAPPPRAADGAGLRRAGAATAPGSTALPLPLLLRPLQPRGARAPRRPSPRRRRADCAAACPACGACRPRYPARMGPPPPRRPRCRAGTVRTESLPARSFARLGVVRRGDEGSARGRMRVERRFHVLVRRLARPLHPQLLEQERERLFQIGPDHRPHALGQIPEPLLEGTDRLLAALIEELLFGVALLPFFLRLGLDPRAHLAPQLCRQRGVLHDDRLEDRRHVDLDRLARPADATGG